MKAFTTIILLLVSLCTLSAGQPDDGVYLSSRDGSAAWVMSQDGLKLFIGARQDLSIQKSTLSSQNNENSQFDLSLTVPHRPEYDKGSGCTMYILIVSGTAYRQRGVGGISSESVGKVSSISFSISEDKNAQQVSQYLHTPIVYRRHPGHNLLVLFTPTKKEFSIGDEATVKLRIRNIGTNTVSFMKGGRNRAARDNQYIFSAYYYGKQVEDIGTSHHFGGMSVPCVLLPGEVFEDAISLSKWFAFKKAGWYQVHGSYYLSFQDPGDMWRTIWEDYVSGDFSVTIKEAANHPVEPSR